MRPTDAHIRRVWYRLQQLDPDEKIPDDRLTYEQCKELADPDCPDYHETYEWMLRESEAIAQAELN